jgi:hypothetical protein
MDGHAVLGLGLADDAEDEDGQRHAEAAVLVSKSICHWNGST